MNKTLQMAISLGVFTAGVGLYMRLRPNSPRPDVSHETERSSSTVPTVSAPASDPRREQLLDLLDTEPYRLPDEATPEEVSALFAEMDRLAKQNDVVSIARLAKFHLHGIGVKKDGDHWEKLVRRAAELGHPKSQYDAAMFVLRDTDTRRNDGKKFKPGTRPAERTGMHPDAEAWLKKAIAGGDTSAMAFLGGDYLARGRHADALPLLQRAAELEAVGCAKYQLATVYLEGKVVPKDLGRVEELLLQSRGCANVGVDAFEIYTEGKQAPVDFGKALRILSGDPAFGPNMIRMGRLYESGGPGLGQDRKKARELYLSAGELGFDVREDLLRLGQSK